MVPLSSLGSAVVLIEQPPIPFYELVDSDILGESKSPLCRSLFPTTAASNLFHARATEMGLVEELVGRVSVKGALLAVPGLLLGYVVYQVLVVASQNLKLARRGPRANRIPSSLPLGKTIHLERESRERVA